MAQQYVFKIQLKFVLIRGTNYLIGAKMELYMAFCVRKDVMSMVNHGQL